MDRNVVVMGVTGSIVVATREGGVDRNVKCRELGGRPKVATREGGVDRNVNACSHFAMYSPSPPARVAWIET